MNRLEAKRPRLLWNEDFRFEHFGVSFDFVVEVNVSNHLKTDQQGKLLRNARSVLAPDGLFCVTPAMKNADGYAMHGFEIVDRVHQQVPEFKATVLKTITHGQSCA